MERRLHPWLVKARAAVSLARPGNAVLAYAAVLVGGVLGGGYEVLATGALHLAALAVVLVASGANADNDRLDLVADAQNRPTRPLPSGALSARAARGLWLGLTGLGLLAAAGVSGAHVGVALAAAGLLAAYSRWWKAWPVVGNGVVAALLALALLYGGAVGGGGTGPLVGAGFAFVTNLARELVKDAEDVDGDRRAHRRTLAVQAGAPAAMRLGQGLALATLLLLPLPYLVMGFGGLYLGGALGCGVCLGGVLQSAPTRTGAARASRLLKLAMGCGVLALALGRLAL